ncbi:hypothetical protein HanPSC8_Chr11g0478531 [Helianthus annuus]|nr:hypothetical protein HanPSC8_Chr11g0478531 [Helianthus annuus]
MCTLGDFHFTLSETFGVKINIYIPCQKIIVFRVRRRGRYHVFYRRERPRVVHDKYPSRVVSIW